MRSQLKKEDWVLHFDGKALEETKDGRKVLVEHQVVVLKNSEKEVRLAVLVLENGKSKTIYRGLKNILDNFELWNCIKMIVTDTCRVNTGRYQGVNTLISKEMQSLGLNPPVLVGCQRHILDTILRHVLDHLFRPQSRSPNIAYWFVSEVEENYHELRRRFDTFERPKLDSEEVAWRDDMTFLKHLCSAYVHYTQNGQFPSIHFMALPNRSNARWNSRAIFALLAFVLLPDKRSSDLVTACDFIISWGKVWFSDHKFDVTAFNFLRTITTPYPKALKSLKTSWSVDPSPIDSERTNTCAERAVKAIQELKPMCRSAATLNSRFFLSNKCDL